MSYIFNPFTGNFDAVGSGGGGSPIHDLSPSWLVRSIQSTVTDVPDATLHRLPELYPDLTHMAGALTLLVFGPTMTIDPTGTGPTLLQGFDMGGNFAFDAGAGSEVLWNLAGTSGGGPYTADIFGMSAHYTGAPGGFYNSPATRAFSARPHFISQNTLGQQADSTIFTGQITGLNVGPFINIFDWDAQLMSVRAVVNECTFSGPSTPHDNVALIFMDELGGYREECSFGSSFVAIQDRYAVYQQDLSNNTFFLGRSQTMYCADQSILGPHYVVYSDVNHNGSFTRRFLHSNGDAHSDIAGPVLIGHTGDVANDSTLLDLDSSTRAMITTRHSDVTVDITSPLAGMIAFDQNTLKHYGYDGSTWNALY